MLELLFALVDARYPFKGGNIEAEALKQKFERTLRQRYPEPDFEGGLEDDQKDGVIPPAVEQAIRKAWEDKKTNAQESGIRQKHATPAVKKEAVSVVLEEVRPMAFFGDRYTAQIVSRDVLQKCATPMAPLYRSMNF